MSIGNALNAAGGGLLASGRLAETVANNVANAMTPGFARRTTELSSTPVGGFGGGVRVAGTLRAENALLTQERRSLAAAAGAAAELGTGHARLLAAVGEPGSAGSLAARVTALETTLLSAAAAPESITKLGHAVSAARALVTTLHAAAAEAAGIRSEAESEIVRQVGILNRAVADVEGLNERIGLGLRQGLDTNPLEDERARLLDRIAEIVPVRTVRREGGAVAIFTASGGALLDGRSWPLRFEPSALVITPGAPAVLNGLQQFRGGPDWADVAVGSGSALMDGGSLGALFELRDRVAVDALDKLDGFAADLLERFAGADPADPTLFLDAGAGRGVAARIELNAAVDPDAGGFLWRLRDGLDAAAPGPEGEARRLLGLADAMTAPRDVGAALGGTARLGSAGFAAEISAVLGAQAARGDEAQAFAAGQLAVTTEREIASLGVDSDSELQFLMLVEQAYAANARVLSVIDALLKQLLEI